MQPVVICAISRKGGAGKTTLIRALASALIHNKKKVLLIDFDPNRALAAWVERAEENNLSSQLLTKAETTTTKELVGIIDNAFSKDSPDYIFIDTPGRGGEWTYTVAMQSDMIITPMILTRTDIEKGMESVAWYNELHETVADKASIPNHVTIITRMTTKTRKGEDHLPKTQGAFLLELQRLLNPIPFALRERQAYQDMDNEGLLGAKADELRGDANPLVRGQAGHFDAALHEAVTVANALLQRVGEPGEPILAREAEEEEA